MAKVNYGQTVNDARGKLGGTVFSKNRYGAFTRRKVTPINRNTTAQSAVRGNFALLSKAWSGTLTDDQRSAWISYAQTYPRLDIFGASITLSGANMYISLNTTLLNIGADTNPTPPSSNVVAPIPLDPTTLSADAPSTLQIMQPAVAPVPANKFYIFGARPMSAGRQPQRSDYRFIGTKAAGTSDFPFNINPASLYVAKFGAWVTDNRISLLISTIDPSTGLVTVGVGATTISD